MPKIYVAGESREHAELNLRVFQGANDYTALQMMRGGLVNTDPNKVQAFIDWLSEWPYVDAYMGEIHEFDVEI